MISAERARLPGLLQRAGTAQTSGTAQDRRQPNAQLDAGVTLWSPNTTRRRGQSHKSKRGAGGAHHAAGRRAVGRARADQEARAGGKLRAAGHLDARLAAHGELGAALAPLAPLRLLHLQRLGACGRARASR